MLKIKRLAAVIVLSGLMLSAAACSQGVKLNIEQPKSIATDDEAKNAGTENETAAVEPSDNVNGKRFSVTLYEFTERYNSAKRLLGDTDLIIAGNWRENGEPQTDNNGIKIQYYYYDDYNVNITATVEVVSGKLMNVGCGTTTSNFMVQEDGKNNSDNVLRKAAIMAEAACCFDENELDNLQDIFFRITTGTEDSLWYEGFVFSLSTQEDKSNSKNSIMLFRVFPISSELKKKWEITEYKP